AGILSTLHVQALHLHVRPACPARARRASARAVEIPQRIFESGVTDMPGGLSWRSSVVLPRHHEPGNTDLADVGLQWHDAVALAPDRRRGPGVICSVPGKNVFDIAAEHGSPSLSVRLYSAGCRDRGGRTGNPPQVTASMIGAESGEKAPAMTRIAIISPEWRERRG